MSAVRIACLALTICAACSTGGEATPPPTAKFCAGDPRVAAFAIGATSTGAANAMKVTLSAAQPSAIVQGVNDWTFDVASPAGAPLDGLTLAVKPTMPDHGHGSSTIPTVTALGGGRYRATGISLPMRGVWSIAIVATGAVNDAATFNFCVDGS